LPVAPPAAAISVPTTTHATFQIVHVWVTVPPPTFSDAPPSWAPAPVTNREFARTLGRVLRRPAILPFPAFAARLAFGQMADELLLASARVLPARLQATGYAFRDPALEGALRRLLAL